jgi:hypothetical protein
LWWPTFEKKKRRKVLSTDKKRSPSRPQYVFCTGNRYGDLHLYYLRGNKVDAGCKSKTESKAKSGMGRIFKRPNSQNQLTSFIVNDLVEDDTWNSLVDVKPENEASSSRIEKKVRQYTFHRLKR